MSIPISPIRPPTQIGSVDFESGQKSTGTAGVFQSILSQAVDGVQQAQDASNAIAERFLAGENVEVHQVAIESQKAEIQFDMFMAVRNKVVSAYQEVMRMQM